MELLARRVFVWLFLPGPPGTTGCPRCGMPWLDRKRRPRLAESVTYARGELGSSTALVLLCAWCWRRTTVDQRIGYARALVMVGPWRRGLNYAACEAVMSAIEHALRSRVSP